MDKLSGAVQQSCLFLLGRKEQAPATFRIGYGCVSPCSDKGATLTLTDAYGVILHEPMEVGHIRPC